jgi:hypothetical protein
MRTCILHIGTHKTGTTALQLFLATNQELFQSLGLSLVAAGRDAVDPYGNHALVRELFYEDPTAMLAQMTAELRENRSDATLVTAEDLSLLSGRPELVDRLIGAIRASGREPKIVVYLRPQAAFAESMYGERIKQGFVPPLTQYIEDALVTGAFTGPGIITSIDFRYTRFLQPWQDAVGRENIVVRAYDATQGSAFIFGDFLSVRRHSTAQPGCSYRKCARTRT